MLRIWELDGEYAGDCKDDSRMGGSASSSYEKPMESKHDLSTKGRKLRGHVFVGVQTSLGAICVCSVPSLTLHESIARDVAGQFFNVSYNGVVRVWDVPKSGVYSTIQIQCLEKDRLSDFKDVEEESEESEDKKGDEDDYGEEKEKLRQTKKEKNAMLITLLVCCGRTVNTVALFTADASGTIGRYWKGTLVLIDHLLALCHLTVCIS